MRSLIILIIGIFVFEMGILASAATAKLTDEQARELMTMIKIINHKSLPYGAIVMQQMLMEANYFADRLQLPMKRPIQITDVRHPIVFDPWYSTIKEAHTPYLPVTVFGSDICNTNVPREQRLRALKIGVSGTFETTNFFFSFLRGKLCDIQRSSPSNQDTEYYADNLDNLIGKSSLIDTNGAYQLATQWLAAVDVDLVALNKLKWTVNQLHYKARATTNYVTLPLYYVDFGNKHTLASGNLKASDEPLISVEILGTTKELQELQLQDTSFSRRPQMIITNALELIQTSSLPKMRFENSSLSQTD